MTVTRALLRATQYRLFYNINHDGGAGDTLTITNAQLLVDAGSSPLLQALLNTPVADDVAAGLLMLTTPGCTHITNTNNGLAPQAWSIEWTADGALRPQLVIRGTPAVASDAVVEVQLTHTYNR